MQPAEFSLNNCEQQGSNTTVWDLQPLCGMLGCKWENAQRAQRPARSAVHLVLPSDRSAKCSVHQLSLRPM